MVTFLPIICQATPDLHATHPIESANFDNVIRYDCNRGVLEVKRRKSPQIIRNWITQKERTEVNWENNSKWNWNLKQLIRFNNCRGKRSRMRIPNFVIRFEILNIKTFLLNEILISVRGSFALNEWSSLMRDLHKRFSLSTKLRANIVRNFVLETTEILIRIDPFGFTTWTSSPFFWLFFDIWDIRIGFVHSWRSRSGDRTG